MLTIIRAIAATFLVSAAWSVGAQDLDYPPELPDARTEIYKSVDGTDLRIWIYDSPGNNLSEQRPAVVFFFGGGYRGGSPAQFEQQAKYLSSRGMVAILVDYRVLFRHGTMVHSAIEDGKAAISWLRENARRLGVDPQRIAASGGSAGGHLAASLATIDSAGEHSPSYLPNALVLFNPALIYAPVEGHPETLEGPPSRIAEITEGLLPEAFSPYHQIRSDMPPAIIFHGRADERVPLTHIELFKAASEAMGNQCEVVVYDGEGHGFFNYGRGDGSAYRDTVRRMDAFFVSLGWLSPGP